MSVIFFFLFLAAVVGVVKPYIPGWKRTYFGAAAVVLFVLIGVAAPKTKRAEQPASSRTHDTENPPVSAGTAPSDDAKPAESDRPASKWSYDTQTDQMRGTTTRFATLASDNTVDLDFPYGEVNGHLTVRKRPTDGLNVMFAVDKGQILCNSFAPSHISVKFDDKPIQRFECSSSSDGSSETAFVEGASRFLSELKKARHTIVEAEFYQKGNQQFSFDTTGLEWK